MRGLVTTLALLTLTASCRRSPVHEVVPHATDDAALRAGDAAADVAESAPVIDAGTVRLAPASVTVIPKIEIAFEGEDADAGPSDASAPRMMAGFRATGLPAITVDGRTVLTVAKDETAKSCTGYGQLLVFELPRTPGRARLVRHLPLFDDCTWDAEPRGAVLVATASARKTRALLQTANAVLARYALRSFDTGPAQSTTEEPHVPLRFSGADLIVAYDHEGAIEAVSAQQAIAREPASKIDLTPIKVLPDGAERSGTLTAATFALDTRSRVLVVHGTYMSVNSWFSGDKTTSVLVF